ncbi:Epsin-2, partial [Mucuna pruriens]
MSIALNKSNSSKMGTPLFHEFKKQASFFLKEKIKTARLALTDVTTAELMTEEATSGNPWAPDSRTLRSISRAAFELDDYWRIVEILHKRLLKFEKKNWRVSYNSMIVLESLLTHGPESVAEEFKSDKDVISQMKGFQYIDDTGFNWGLTVRKKSERIMKLLEEGTLLKEERKQARRLSRGIEGFGSFSHRPTPAQAILPLREKSLPTTLRRYDSDLNNHEDQENQSSCSNNGVDVDKVAVKSPSPEGGTFKGYQDDHGNNQMIQKSETSSKENMEPSKEEFHLWNLNGESKPLLDCGEEDSKLGIIRTEDDHPFNSTEKHATSSLLSARDGILQGFAKPALDSKSKCMIGSEKQIGHKKKDGTDCSSETCNCFNSLTREGVNSGLSLLLSWQHCNPSSTNRVAAVEFHSPAEESKIEDNSPHETALRTSPANPTGVLPVRSCKMMSPKEYMSDLGVSTPVLRYSGSQFRQSIVLGYSKSKGEDCFFGISSLGDFHWASIRIQVTRLQGKHQAKSTDEGAGDYQELEPGHTSINFSWFTLHDGQSS